MSETIEIEFEPAYEGVPDEKVEEAINDLRKRLKNFERGGVKATWKRKESSRMTDVYLLKDGHEIVGVFSERAEARRIGTEQKGNIIEPHTVDFHLEDTEE